MKHAKRSGTLAGKATSNGYAVSRNLMPQLYPVADCKPLGRETRRHSPQQVRKLAASLQKFGFVLPILIDAGGHVVAGWGLVLASRQLRLHELPAVELKDLTQAELRALRLALNRLGEDSKWDCDALAVEFSEIQGLGLIDLTSTGFEMAEIDLFIEG